MRRISRWHIPAAVMAAGFLFSGCGPLNHLSRPLGQAATTLFTSATFADLQMIGVRTGPVIPVQAGSCIPSTIPVEGIGHRPADILGQEVLGVLLQITKVGETTPRWMFCPAGELQKRCEEVPSNARVTFTGQPLGSSFVFLPTRLTWSAR